MSIVTSTKIELISNALVLLGEKPLTSLDENRYGATVGAALFEHIYENELQSHPWRFSMKKASLSRLVAEPLNQYQYTFQMPVDCLLPRFVYPRTGYEIYGQHLYANQTSIDLDYQFKPGIDKIPAYFAMLMHYALARDMAEPIKEKQASIETFARKYILQRDRAQYADSQGRPASPIQHNPFTDVRGA